MSAVVLVLFWLAVLTIIAIAPGAAAKLFLVAAWLAIIGFTLADMVRAIF